MGEGREETRAGGESCKRGSGAVDLNHDLWSQRSLELVSKF